MAEFDPGAWTAVAAWVAIAVVVAALIYGWRQYLKARDKRAELTQPNVAMFMEPSGSDWHLVELVVRNYGQTPAYGLRFEFANPPTVGKYESSYDDNFVDIAPLNLPAEIPYLAPSQEWRIVWDSALDRKQLGEAIASRFDGAVTYYDQPASGGKPAGKKFRNTAVLDWATLPPSERVFPSSRRSFSANTRVKPPMMAESMIRSSACSVVISAFSSWLRIGPAVSRICWMKYCAACRWREA